MTMYWTTKQFGLTVVEKWFRISVWGSSLFFPSQLSSNLRHVRVYEMDVEDEEDEERPESQNASSNQDGLEETPAIQGEAEGGETEGGGQRAKELLESGEALELS